jgi:hypothetical protein
MQKFLTLILVWGWFFTAAPLQPSPNMKLIALEKSPVVGKATTWRLEISTENKGAVQLVMIEGADRSHWALGAITLPPPFLNEEKTQLEILATPLSPGEYLPALVVTYRASGREYSLVVQAESNQEVVAVEDLIQTKLVLPYSVPDIQHSVSGWLEIQNRSPFELTGSFIPDKSGNIRDIQKPFSVPMGLTRVPFTATVKDHESLVVTFDCTWDDGGSPSGLKTASFSLTSAPSTSFLSNYWAIVQPYFGIVLGAALTFFLTRFKDYRDAATRYQQNKEKIGNLIIWAIHEVRRGTSLEDKIILVPFEQIIASGDLYGVLSRERISQSFWSLYSSCGEYNRLMGVSPLNILQTLGLDEKSNVLENRLKERKLIPNNQTSKRSFLFFFRKEGSKRRGQP